MHSAAFTGVVILHSFCCQAGVLAAAFRQSERLPSCRVMPSGRVNGLDARAPPTHAALFRCCSKKPKIVSEWDVEATPSVQRWDATPGLGATPAAGGSRWEATPTPGRPLEGATPRRNRWDETPTPGHQV